MGEPDDMAHGIRYLVADESKLVTGAEVAISGGYTAQQALTERAAYAVAILLKYVSKCEVYYATPGSCVT
jgi:hypothetical protein